MIDKILKEMGWKTYSGRWDKDEIKIDLITIFLLSAVVAFAVWTK